MDETGMFMSQSDITERQRGEEAPRETYPILQSALDALPAQIAILDEAGIILAVNAAWRRFVEADLEVGPAGTVGANYLHLCDAGSAKAGPAAAGIAQGIRSIFSTERFNFYFEYLCCPSTADRWFAVRVSRFAEPGPVRVVMAFEDVTERKLVDEELRLHDRAMAASGEGIVITDPQKPNNPIIYVNTGFERLTGYSKDHALGKSCRFLQGGETDPAALAEIRAALHEQRECRVELLNYRSGGTPFWNQLSITPVRDDSGKLIHYVGVQSDITARKHAEAELKSANDKLARANAEITAASERLTLDLATAAKVQQALLPTTLPDIPGVRFAWTYEPCDELAGDILNVVRLDEKHVGLYLLDVSGHGVASALLSVTVSHLLSKMPDLSLALGSEANDSSARRPLPPAQVAEQLNKQFRWNPEVAQFFTLLYGVLDWEAGEFRYVAAGHPGPICVPVDAAPFILDAPTGCPIGMLESDYQEASVRLKPGDRLYIYSDGITESMNREGELFGEERLVALLDECRAAPLESSLSSMLRSVEGWRCSTCLKDDISILALEMAPD